jgi:glycosyltransferase involved in cell wall biosynthesis
MLKLSVIIPTYNIGEFLEQLLLSIFKQSYRNIELIIIDGKSTDNTIDIIKKHESHIQYWISEKDTGGEAYNKGLKYATGDIITYIGGDDYYIDSKAFERMVNEFENNPYLDILLCNINIIDRKSESLICEFKNDTKLYLSLNKHDNSIIRHIKYGCLSGLVFAGMSIRKLSILNFKFDIYNSVSDYDFILYMWKKGSFFHYIDRELINVRQGGVSQTTKMSVIIRDRFLVNKKYFGLLMAIRKNPLLLYLPPIIQYLRSYGFRPFFWLRNIRSYVKERIKI